MWRFKIEQVWEKAGGTVAAPHGHQAAMREVTRLVEHIDQTTAPRALTTCP